MGIPRLNMSMNNRIVIDLKMHKRLYESEEDTLMRLLIDFKTIGIKEVIVINERCEEFILKL